MLIWKLVTVICSALFFQQGLEFLISKQNKILAIPYLFTGALFAGLFILPQFPILVVLAAGTLCFVLHIAKLKSLYNGGSDQMTFWIFVFVIIAHYTGKHSATNIHEVTLVFATVGALSYFIAGITKLVQPSWRNGSALKWANQLSCYTSLTEPPKCFSKMTVGFEVLYPLGLVSPWAAYILCPLAMGFHLSAAFTYGFNRFVLPWLAVNFVVLSLHVY